MRRCQRCGRPFRPRDLNDVFCPQCERPAETFPPEVPTLDKELQWS